jgi:endonuclease-3
MRLWILDKLSVALGGTLGLDALLTVEEYVITDAINKGWFWRRNTQLVSFPSFPSFPTLGLTKARYIGQAAQRLRDDFDLDVPKTVNELVLLPGGAQRSPFCACLLLGICPSTMV